MSREDYKEVIEQEINQKLSQESGAYSPVFKYEKNNPNMYSLLKKFGDEAVAIANAYRLCQTYHNQKYADHNPCTKVHELVIEINNLADEEEE